MSQSNPEQIVTLFLKALEAQDHDQIASLLAPDLHYTNVSLPTLIGGKKSLTYLSFYCVVGLRYVSGREWQNSLMARLF